MAMFLYLLIVGCIAWIFGLIFRKMGYSAWTGALNVIPIVNLVWWLHLATCEWPIEKQLSRATNDGASPEVDHLTLMFRSAESCEGRGQYAEALKMFQLLADELDGRPGTHLAMHCAERMRQKMAAA
jgi:hypothetical protein